VFKKDNRAMLAAAFFGAGFVSFEFVSYHLSSRGTVTEHWIPLFVVISTGMGVVASLILGRLYDRIGLPVVLVGVFLCSLFSPLVFLGGFTAALAGLVLWVWATRRRIRCSIPVSPVCCRRAGEISPSGFSTPGTASAGWLEVRPPVSCTSGQYAQ
jgi:MFS family permease